MEQSPFRRRIDENSTHWRNIRTSDYRHFVLNGTRFESHNVYIHGKSESVYDNYRNACVTVYAHANEEKNDTRFVATTALKEKKR